MFNTKKVLTLGWWMVIIEGAIDILTDCHWSCDVDATSLSIESFKGSIPVAFATCVQPR